MRAQLLRFALTLPASRSATAGSTPTPPACSSACRSTMAPGRRDAGVRHAAHPPALEPERASCPSAPRPSSSGSAGAARGTRTGREAARCSSWCGHAVRPTSGRCSASSRPRTAPPPTIRAGTDSPRRGPSRATAAGTGRAPAEAETADVDGHRRGADAARCAPDLGDELLAREDLAGMARQERQQVELAPAQVDHPPRDLHPAPRDVDRQLAIGSAAARAPRTARGSDRWIARRRAASSSRASGLSISSSAPAAKPCSRSGSPAATRIPIRGPGSARTRRTTSSPGSGLSSASTTSRLRAARR